MQQGLLVKAFSSFYYVLCDGIVWECRSRGKFKVQHQDILVGDRVRFTGLNENLHKGVLEEILPRRNFLIRPPLANIDLLVLIMAAALPEPNLILLDRMLLFSAYYGLQPIICINKADLITPAQAEQLLTPYCRAGYKTVLLSTYRQQGLAELQQLLKGQVAAFAGPSGVGKSSVLNALSPGQGVKTGAVSVKIQRGRHTTRHVEFFPLADQTVIADTPGFTSLELPDIASNQLMYYYPEMQPYLNQCRFSTCLHHNEPDCLVKEALAAGKICEQRYASYLYFLAEIAEKNRRLYK